MLESNEFEALFGGKGFLVQPRPDNKPKSTVTIMTFVRALLLALGLYNPNLILERVASEQLLWWRYEGPERKHLDAWGFVPLSFMVRIVLKFLLGAPSFSKSVKIGPCDVTVESMEVNYSKNGMKCTLKFEVHGDGDDICYGGGFGKTYIYGAGMLF